jgi:hypothetical protein
MTTTIDDLAKTIIKEFGLPSIEEVDVSSKKYIQALEEKLLKVQDVIKAGTKPIIQDLYTNYESQMIAKLKAIPGVTVAEAAPDMKNYDISYVVTKSFRVPDTYLNPNSVVVTFPREMKDKVETTVKKYADYISEQKKINSIRQCILGFKPKQEQPNPLDELKQLQGITVEERKGYKYLDKDDPKVATSKINLPSIDGFVKSLAVSYPYEAGEKVNAITRDWDGFIEAPKRARILINTYINIINDYVNLIASKTNITQMNSDFRQNPLAHIYVLRENDVHEGHYNALTQKATPLRNVDGLKPEQLFDAEVIKQITTESKGNIYVVDARTTRDISPNVFVDKGVKYAKSQYDMHVNSLSPIEMLKATIKDSEAILR